MSESVLALWVLIFIMVMVASSWAAYVDFRIKKIQERLESDDE